VSDRAKALINLAQEKFKVVSVADLFHLKQCINHLLALALSSKLESSREAFERVKDKPEVLIESSESMYSQMQFYTDLYVESVQNISHQVHPYCEGNQINTSERAKSGIESQMEAIHQIVENCEITDKYKLFEKAANQIESAVSVINLWHELVNNHIQKMNIDSHTRAWLQNELLPQTYWELALQRTKHKPTIEKIKLELNHCNSNKYKINPPQMVEKEELHKLKQSAIDLCKMFQRSSSQVEGRNGYLSLLNHAQRGFDTKRIEVLTVVHNFDIKGIDGKTPAQRLFKEQIEHTSIFDYLVKNITTLAIPRKRNTKYSKYQPCPTLCG